MSILFYKQTNKQKNTETVNNCKQKKNNINKQKEKTVQNNKIKYLE